MAATSGKKALTELDRILTRARKARTRIHRQYGGARDSLARLKAQRVRIYARLARLRLLAIEQGNLPTQLEEADRKALAILERRDAAIKALDLEIQSAETELAATEARRSEQQATVDEAAKTVDDAEAIAQQSLEDDEAYREQLERTARIDLIADRAEDKAEAALKNRVIKGKPYESDALFSYLWSRGYGTSNYHAFPLTRWLDGKVAALCDYETARRNFSMLQEIPARLTEHAESMRQNFDRETETLTQLERKAAEHAGVPELDKTLTSAESSLSAIDTEIEQQEAVLRALLEKRRAFSAGEDGHYAQCIEVLSQSMQDDSMRLLRDRAARTLHPEDDALVRELEDLSAESIRADNDLTEFGRLAERESRLVDDLENIRRRFKAKRFDDALSEFKDWGLVALLLNQFLGGSAESDEIWKTIERQQRRRPRQARPDFGSMRFPRSPKRGPWRMPGGGFGGGSFKTGGGFRGGGFKTGGGF